MGEEVKKRKPGSSQWCPRKGQRGNEQKLKHEAFLLNIRKNFLLQGWSNTVRNQPEIVDSPSLEMFKTQPDMALNNLLKLLWAGRLDKKIS